MKLFGVDMDRRVYTTPRALVAVMWIFLWLGSAAAQVSAAIERGDWLSAAVGLVIAVMMVAPVTFWARNWRESMHDGEDA